MAAGDIGIWRQSTGGTAFDSTTYTNFPFNTEVRADGDLAGRDDNTGVQLPVGRFLLIYNIAMNTLSGSNRSERNFRVYLNGSALSGIHGGSSLYIRRSGSADEDCASGAVIFDNDTADHKVEIRVAITDDQSSNSSGVFANSCGKSIVQLDSSWPFASYTGAATQAINTSHSFVEQTLQSTDEESGGISRSGNDISLNADKWYLCCWSQEYQSGSQRQAGIGRALLDGTEIPGSRVYGYARNSNSVNDPVGSAAFIFKTPSGSFSRPYINV